jgi:outer membrane protein OmpA-like peptidoglycan-associated protein
MKMKKNIFIILLISIVLLPGILAGQKKILKADDAAEYYNYTEAIPHLEAVIARNNKDKVKAIIMLADVYMNMNNAVKAEEWYSQAIDTPGIPPVSYYNYGQVLRTLGKYELAYDQFVRYDTLVPDDPRGKMYASFSDQIRLWTSLPPSAEVLHAENLNSEYADFSPAFYKKEVVFTSDRPSEKNTALYGWTATPYLNLFVSRTNSNLQSITTDFNTPSYFSSKINQEFHDGPASFTQNGDTIFLTRTIDQKASKNQEDKIKTYVLKMYFSYLVNNVWRNPEPFFLNENDFSVGHPALSKDGKTIYFASDMPGGLGGTDLYVCTWEVDKWSDPRNLGPVINSIGDEMFPSIFDSVLYFSSDGHLGYGGLDIFKSELQDTIWSYPVNLLSPLNSSYDDFGITFYNAQQIGLFSSNRPGGKGSDDIYVFQFMLNTIAGYAVDCSETIILAGQVKHKQNLKPIPGATIFAVNKKTNNVLIAKTDESGRYEIEVDANTSYQVKAMKEDYMSDCYALITKNYPQKARDLLLDQLEVNKVFKLENIYYDLDKWNIRPDAAAELDKLVTIMKENPIKIELSSHTDCRASDKYNDLLSQRRAESAVAYIISQGIEADRMVAKGYGESKLVNRCKDGVKCSETEHQENRRTEFTVLEILKKPIALFKPLDQFFPGELLQVSQFDNDFFASCAFLDENEITAVELPGKCNKPMTDVTLFVLNTKSDKVQIIKSDMNGRFEFKSEPNAEYIIKARKDGYMGDCLTSKIESDPLLLDDLKLRKYKIGQSTILEDLNFDRDKAVLKPEAKRILDKVVEFINENQVILELSSHTDCLENDTYNQNLSQQRAEAAVNYIISRGIDPSRILAKGYGESQLINNCDDGVPCTDEQHKINRRTEIKITGIYIDETPAFKPLDQYKSGETFDRNYFPDEFFSGCPFKAPLNTGTDAEKEREWK